MAGIDKVHEFYTCLARFVFLSQCYPPDDIPEHIREACQQLRDYSNNVEIKKRLEEADEYFRESDERIEMHKRKDLISEIVKECCR
jgi:hypothetical protein